MNLHSCVALSMQASAQIFYAHTAVSNSVANDWQAMRLKCAASSISSRLDAFPVVVWLGVALQTPPRVKMRSGTN
jgi:hypothetical protein